MEQLIKAVIDTQKNSYRAIGQVNAGDDLELELEIKMNGQSIEFISPQSELIIKKADNNRVRQTKDIVYEDGKFKIRVDEQGVTCTGIVVNQLTINDGGRISTCLFYFMVDTSLDGEILKSISKVEVLEQLEEYIVTAFANLKDFEEKVLSSDETIRKLNYDMNESEKIRDTAELQRQETFKSLKENMNEAITNLESSINLSNMNEKERSEVFNSLKSNLESIKQDLINLNASVESEEEKRVQAEINRVNKALEIIEKLESTNNSVATAEAERVSEFNKIKTENNTLKEALTTINNTANSNEEVRKENETSRVEAEKARVNEFNTMKLENETFKQEINEQYEDIVTEFDKVIANVTNGNENATNSEIVQARGKEVNLNARLDNFDEQLDNKASKTEVGSPLIASSVSGMTDKTKVYVNTTDGNWYSWNGTAWVVGGVYNSQGIGDKSITEKKTTFIEVVETKNHIDKSKVEVGFMLNKTTGVLEANSNYNTTDFINVENFVNYYIYYRYSGAYFCIYDSSKNYLSTIQNIQISNNRKLNSSYNAIYIRVTYVKSDEFPDLRMTLTQPTEFEDYEEYIKPSKKLIGIEVPADINKLDKEQGVENSGKFMQVSDDGFIKPSDFVPGEDNRLYVGKKIVNVNQSEETISIGTGATRTTQNGVVAIGCNAMKNLQEANATTDNGKFNVAIGNHAMMSTTTGDHNTAVGWSAMKDNVSGKFNTAVGEDALLHNISGEGNTCIGNRAYQNGIGSRNTVVGTNAMFTTNTGTQPSGNANTAVGYLAGNGQGGGSNNTAIGADAKSQDGVNYSIAIGSNARATKSKQCVIGTAKNILENILFGDLIICQGGVYRKLVFNSDNSISWIQVTV